MKIKNSFLRNGLLIPLVILLSAGNVYNIMAQGFLRAENGKIVNEKGENILLRGMGLGGWMLQEGYMLRVYNEGQQYRIRERISGLIGPVKTKEFYEQWLNNHTRKSDIDSLKAWGFNSIRLPMHFDLYTLPADQEPVPGQQTWLEKGFAMTDSLLNWCKANKMYLILDLHAAPGGQGNDLNISDRDPSKLSLWDSEANQVKTIALWKMLAERYANESWIGAYDLINEPNWGFEDKEDKNGLREQKNVPLKKLLVDITNAIREVDQKHIIIIEGNGWGNNYNGMLPPWDDNMVMSFHKYWNNNDEASIRHIIEARTKYNVPVWLGETGENSNVWFTQCIELLEKNNIGWAWWPIKKLGNNNPLEVKMNPEYQQVLNYWAGNGPKPAQEVAQKGLNKLTDDLKTENNILHYDVVDAMIRQPHTRQTLPFATHPINKPIPAAHYDLGRIGMAYYDVDSANYRISGGQEGGNKGRTFRNDGVDIETDSIDGSNYVNHIETGEWLQYTINNQKAGTYYLYLTSSSTAEGTSLAVSVNGKDILTKPISKSGETWKREMAGKVKLAPGKNIIRLTAAKGGFHLKSLELRSGK